LNGLHQQFDFSLIAKAGNDSPVACGVRSGQQQSSRGGKCALQLHVALEESRTVVIPSICGLLVAGVEIRFAGLR
jgi:hypothetical protein